MKALTVKRGEFPRMGDSLRDRLMELSARNENLDEQIIRRAENLCNLKEQAVKRFDEIIHEQEELLSDNLKD